VCTISGHWPGRSRRHAPDPDANASRTGARATCAKSLLPASCGLGSALAPGPRRTSSGSVGVSGRRACGPIAGSAPPELPLEVVRPHERVCARRSVHRVRAQALQRREVRGQIAREVIASASVRALAVLAWCAYRAGSRGGGSEIDRAGAGTTGKLWLSEFHTPVSRSAQIIRATRKMSVRKLHMCK
jgi:hypothetical protein